MTRSVVLFSRENFAWLSMQEIIPELCSAWLGSARPGVHSVRVVCVDDCSFAEASRAVLESDNVVLAAFNFRIARLVRFSREKLRLDFRLTVHLHGMASVAGWPLREFLGECLFAHDVFVTTCEVDAQIWKACAPHAQIEVIPFTLAEFNPSAQAEDPGPVREFSFVGRVSPQKNLHSLILAYAILHRERGGSIPPLVIYGGEDGLGSPNMGAKISDYRSWLEQLVKRLGLSDAVVFRGFMERAELNAALSARNHVLVSASLHSDENFGMAAFRSLSQGMPAVLSAWGGHHDLARYFPAGQTQLVDVRVTDAGPVLSPHEFARQMGLAAESTRLSPAIPEHYLGERITREYLRLATLPSDFHSNEKLIFSTLAERVNESRARILADSKDPMKIFSGYADPLARPFFEHYAGGAKAGVTTQTGVSHLGVRPVPWVESEGEAFVVNDPHRGVFRAPLSDEGLDQLYRWGFAFSDLPELPNLQDQASATTTLRQPS